MLDYKLLRQKFKEFLAKEDAESINSWIKFDQERLIIQSLSKGHLIQSLESQKLITIVAENYTQLPTGFAGAGEYNYAMAA